MTERKKPRITPRGLKAKGDKFERELASWFNTQVFNGEPRASRAPLSGGGFTSLNSGGADLLGLPGLFVEAKRVERLNFHEAMAQAVGNVTKRHSPDVPAVISRRNQQSLPDALVTMRLSDFTRWYRQLLLHHGCIKSDPSMPEDGDG